MSETGPKKLETKKQEYYAYKENDAKTDTQTIKEKDIPQLKNGNDIGYTEFMNKYSIYRADGTMVSATVKERAPIFRKFIHSQRLLDLGIVADREAGNRSYKVILGEKLSELQRVTGYRIAPKKDTSHIPYKKDNDIGISDFIQSYSVLQSDSTYMGQAEQKELFRALIQDQQLISLGIISKRRNSTGHVRDCIIGDRLTDLQKIKGYYIAKQNDASFIPLKKDNDLNKNAFLSKYYIYGVKGQRVTSEILNDSLENQELLEKGIVAIRRNSNGTIENYVIGDKLQEFSKELLRNGYFVIEKDKETQISAPKENDICCDIHYHDRAEMKLYQDRYIDLYRNPKGYNIYEQGGRAIECCDNSQIFNDLISNTKLIDSSIIVWRRFPWGYIHPVIDGDKIQELQQITGYQMSRREAIVAPQESDIDLATFNEAYAAYYFNTEMYGCKTKLYNKRDRYIAFNRVLDDESLLAAGIVVERMLSNGNIEKFINGKKLEELKQESDLVICLTKEDYIKELREEYFELNAALAKATDYAKKSKFAYHVKKNVHMLKFLSDGKDIV